MEKITKRIALLATGDEIINGDISDSNTQYFAQQFIDHNILPGNHLTASDDENDIARCIHFLLQDHSALITVGGLGPTSDDRTRFALAKVLQRPLLFDETTWQNILALLAQYKLTIPESNKQQCLFPEGSEILPNRNGTAAACFIQHGDQQIFMLPGPPNECFPIFDTLVMPKLLQDDYQQPIYRKTWLLLGVSEGAIAEQLDPLTENSGCVIGYRVNFPYLEVKLHASLETSLEKLAQRFEPIFANHLVSTNKQWASDQFLDYLQTFDRRLCFRDQATMGRLEARLMQPNTAEKLAFQHTNYASSGEMHIHIEGLMAYWHHDIKVSTSPINIKISDNQQIHNIQKQIPIRGEKTLSTAVEVICWELLGYLSDLFA